MGKARLADGKLVELAPATQIGSHPACQLVVSDRRVSVVHAVVCWVAPGKWELRDAGSTNGTFLNGTRIGSAGRYPLLQGSVLGLGSSEPFLTMADVSRPCPEALELSTGERVLGLNQLLTLTSEVPEEFCDVLETSSGTWVTEVDGEVRQLRDGDIVPVGSRRYRIALPIPIPETEQVSGAVPRRFQSAPLGGGSLVFSVSADLEHVEMQVRWCGQVWTTRRAYNRALVELARVRIAERDSSLAPHEQGWTYADDLCTLADYDSLSRLNVEIHRARAELSRCGVPNAPAIVERRPRSGQLRIGTDLVEIRGARSAHSPNAS